MWAHRFEGVGNEERARKERAIEEACSGRIYTINEEKDINRRNETTSYRIGDGLMLVRMSSMTGRTDLEGNAPMA